MRKVSVLLLGLLSGFVVASEQRLVAPLEVESIRVVDSQLGTSKVDYRVDGLEIELTAEDKVKARNWYLSEEDWAKYKYAMQYTPRGLVSPNLEPPIVLGVMATNDRARTRYANIMNRLELDRQEREIAFQQAANVLLAQMKPDEVVELSPIQQQFGQKKTALNSVFLDASSCDVECRRFLMRSFAGTSSTTQLTYYYFNGNESQARSVVLASGVSSADIERKDVYFLDGSELIKRYESKHNVPFRVYQNGEQTRVFEVTRF
ncbi:hypothetical protein A6E01_19365 (plasmid) [Vibrio breoganii]|uniref:DUF4892 domain-containing protein n=2 Tax=Vibrio TaxID=662 RepID=A0AAN1CU88_9VIBR|nr:hypothetical protein [Vibrio breoganii]ANO35375.1 hypothetical protein A6E01_19365 [Vibrio breoganii]